MAYTHTRAGNRFVVIEPAPSQNEFLAGSRSAENEHDLKIRLVDIEHDTQLGNILENGELKDAAVAVEMSFGGTIYGRVSGRYSGVASELWLTMGLNP